MRSRVNRDVRSPMLAVLAITLALVLPAAALADEGLGTDGIIVTLEDGGFALLSDDGEGFAPAAEVVADDLEELGMEVTGADELLGQTVLTAEAPEGMDDFEAAEAAAALPGVAAAQPNFIYELIEPLGADDAEEEARLEELAQGSPLGLLALTNDPGVKSQWWLSAAHFPEAWDLVKTNNQVTVVVADSAMLGTHEDLQANILRDLAWDSTYGTGQALDWDTASPTDASTQGGHATHVAGIVAGQAGNGRGIAGGSYNANILPVRVVRLNDAGTAVVGSTTTVMYAYNYVINLATLHPELNIKAINLSLGYYPDYAYSNPSAGASIDAKVLEYIKLARENGIVTVCAGGNGGSASLGAPAGARLLPSDFDEVISVTALTQSMSDPAGYDYNAAKDISAPGIEIYSSLATSGTAYGWKSGTSMATPMVSAAVALLFAAVPDATIEDVEEALYQTADAVSGKNASNGSAGALNVAAAVKYLQEHSGNNGGGGTGGDDPDPGTGGDDPDPSTEPQPVPGASFPDVPATHWVKTEGWLDYVVEQNLMGAVGSTGQFKPNDKITRGQVATILFRSVHPGDQSTFSGAKDVKNASKFTDNKDGQFYTAAINWAAEQGILTGDRSTGYTTVRPNASITRQELAIMLYRFASTQGADLSGASAASYASAPDAPSVADWAEEGVGWCFSKRVMTGDSKTGKLNPGGSATRAEMAKMITVVHRDLL